MNPNSHHEILDADASEIRRAEQASSDFLRQREALGGDSTLSRQIEAIMSNFGGVTINPTVCEELLDFLCDEGLMATTRQYITPALNGYEVICRFKEILKLIWSYQPTVKLYCLFRVLNQDWLDDIYGGMDQTEFARQMSGQTVDGKLVFSMTKQNVNKEMRETRHRLRKLGFTITPRDDERDDEARFNMKTSAEKRLSKNPNQITNH